MFNANLVRLLRGLPGWTADSLAEELTTMFKADIPVDIPEGIVLNGRDRVPITIEDYPGSDATPFLQIKRGDDVFSLTLNELGFTPADGGPGGSEPAAPGTFRGTVVSGTGATYLVSLAGKPDPVTVTQMQIDAGSTIPAGTKAAVFKIGSSHFMQVPVWV